LAVDAMDLLRTRRATGPGAPIGNRYDFNCDGKVAAADVLFVRNKQRRSLGALAALTPAAAPRRRRLFRSTTVGPRGGGRRTRATCLLRLEGRVAWSRRCRFSSFSFA